LDCYVLCGYPEIDGDKYYNSAQFINRRGELIMNHRKKHLFEADKTWASEGYLKIFYLNEKRIKL
jgi:predicted amidohydrolase